MSTLKQRFPGKPSRGNGVRESIHYSESTNSPILVHTLTPKNSAAPLPIQVTPILISPTPPEASQQSSRGRGGRTAPVSVPVVLASTPPRPSRASTRKIVPVQKFSPPTSREKKLVPAAEPSPPLTISTSQRHEEKPIVTKKVKQQQPQAQPKSPLQLQKPTHNIPTNSYATKGGIPDSQYSAIAAQTATNLKAFRALFGSSGESDEEFRGFTQVTKLTQGCKRKVRDIQLEVLTLQQELITASRSYSLSSEEEFTPVIFPRKAKPNEEPICTSSNVGADEFPGFSDDDYLQSSTKAQKLKKAVKDSESELSSSGEGASGVVLNGISGQLNGKKPNRQTAMDLDTNTNVPAHKLNGFGNDQLSATSLPFSKYPVVKNVNAVPIIGGDGAYRSGKFILEESTESEETEDEDTENSLDNDLVLSSNGLGTNEELLGRQIGDGRLPRTRRRRRTRTKTSTFNNIYPTQLTKLICPLDLQDVENNGFPIIVDVTSGSVPPKPLCFLCGSAGIEQLLYCCVCCEPYHPYCTGDTSLESAFHHISYSKSVKDKPNSETSDLSLEEALQTQGILPIFYSEAAEPIQAKSISLLSPPATPIQFPIHQLEADLETKKKYQLQNYFLNWTCSKCKVCSVCHKSGGKCKDFLRCSSCNQHYHKSCTSKTLPCYRNGTQEWLCENCFKCFSCGKSLEEKNYGKPVHPMTVNNELFCRTCFKQRQQGSFCPLCFVCYSDDDFDLRMVQCEHCNRWIHANCENIFEEHYQVLSNLPSSVQFICRLCDTSGNPFWRQAIDVELRNGIEAVFRLFQKKAITSFRKRKALEEEEAKVVKAKRNLFTETPKLLIPITPTLSPKMQKIVDSTGIKLTPCSILLKDCASLFNKFLAKEETTSQLESEDEPDLNQSSKNDSNVPYTPSKRIHDLLENVIGQLDFEATSVLSTYTLAMRSFENESNVEDTIQLKDQFEATIKEVFRWFDLEELTKHSIGHNKFVANSNPSINQHTTQVSSTLDVPKPHVLWSHEILPNAFEDKFWSSNVQQDPRECSFCHQFGDNPPESAGRLLWAGLSDWVHVNCALWSSEVYEHNDGALLQVGPTLVRSKLSNCTHCNQFGASVACCLQSCKRIYHFPCALNGNCKLLENKSVFCPDHAKKAKGDPQLDMQVMRKVYVDIDWFKKREKPKTSRDIKLFVGSLRIDRIGNLVPLSITDDIPEFIPLGYRGTRIFWSVDTIYRKMPYSFYTKLDRNIQNKLFYESVAEKQKEVHIVVDHSKSETTVKNKLKQINKFHNWIRTAPRYVNEFEEEWIQPCPYTFESSYSKQDGTDADIEDNDTIDMLDVGIQTSLCSSKSTSPSLISKNIRTSPTDSLQILDEEDADVFDDLTEDTLMHLNSYVDQVGFGFSFDNEDDCMELEEIFSKEALNMGPLASIAIIDSGNILQVDGADDDDSDSSDSFEESVEGSDVESTDEDSESEDDSALQSETTTADSTSTSADEESNKSEPAMPKKNTRSQKLNSKVNNKNKTKLISQNRSTSGTSKISTDSKKQPLPIRKSARGNSIVKGERTLRSREKKPTLEFRSQEQKCPQCKKLFQSKNSLNRHTRFCKPKKTKVSNERRDSEPGSSRNVEPKKSVILDDRAVINKPKRGRPSNASRLINASVEIDKTKSPTISIDTVDEDNDKPKACTRCRNTYKTGLSYNKHLQTCIEYSTDEEESEEAEPLEPRLVHNTLPVPRIPLHMLPPEKIDKIKRLLVHSSPSTSTTSSDSESGLDSPVHSSGQLETTFSHQALPIPDPEYVSQDSNKVENEAIDENVAGIFESETEIAIAQDGEIEMEFQGEIERTPFTTEETQPNNLNETFYQPQIANDHDPSAGTALQTDSNRQNYFPNNSLTSEQQCPEVLNNSNYQVIPSWPQPQGSSAHYFHLPEPNIINPQPPACIPVQYPQSSNLVQNHTQMPLQQHHTNPIQTFAYKDDTGQTIIMQSPELQPPIQSHQVHSSPIQMHNLPQQTQIALQQLQQKNPQLYQQQILTAMHAQQQMLQHSVPGNSPQTMEPTYPESMESSFLASKHGYQIVQGNSNSFLHPNKQFVAQNNLSQFHYPTQPVQQEMMQTCPNPRLQPQLEHHHGIPPSQQQLVQNFYGSDPRSQSIYRQHQPNSSFIGSTDIQPSFFQQQQNPTPMSLMVVQQPRTQVPFDNNISSQNHSQDMGLTKVAIPVASSLPNCSLHNMENNLPLQNTCQVTSSPNEKLHKNCSCLSCLPKPKRKYTKHGPGKLRAQLSNIVSGSNQASLLWNNRSSSRAPLPKLLPATTANNVSPASTSSIPSLRPQMGPTVTSDSIISPILSTGAISIPSSKGNTLNPNIAVVRPMEHPLQKMSEQVLQIGSTPHPSLTTNDQSRFPYPVPGTAKVDNIEVKTIPVVSEFKLVHVKDDSPPLPKDLDTASSIEETHVARIEPETQDNAQEDLLQDQPKLEIKDSVQENLLQEQPQLNNTEAFINRIVEIPEVAKTEAVSVPVTEENKQIVANPGIYNYKLRLTSKPGRNSYCIDSFDGPAKNCPVEPMKTVKVKGKITTGENAGTSTEIIIRPVPHSIPIPDPDANENESNRTIAEEECQDVPAAIETIDLRPQQSGEVNLKAPLTHRAVIVYEVMYNNLIHFRSGDVRAIWNYVLEKVQGVRLNHNLPPLSYPDYNLSLPGNKAEAAKAFKKTGLTHRAVQFLLEQLPALQTVVSKQHVFKYHEPPKVSEEDTPVIANITGCARSEGYHGRKPFDMFGWLASKHRQPMARSQGSKNDNMKNTGIPPSMQFRNLNKHGLKHLNVFWSSIHGRGLFTTKDIEVGEMIIEYAGEVIRSGVCDLREKYYESKGIGCYFFKIDEDCIVDATMKGNASRFINHSCEPNCRTRIVEIHGQKRLVIFALRRIPSGEELTYDYKFPFEDVKIPCTCGTPRCRKFLN